ncbi:Podospora anserina S mat+ genomic DNA chromosome 3, supercontig 2 [Trichuris trichiura]|uniref:Podospora anserina S mat+ genomic DNA chromosome 3, supercontig 2 n=1 Tax=Trichuris trichiura TaxID=36087 RepID=A0A077ZLW9_TRITR|nr:Podospora anserina S mat+ genomic DNA chromosome 3, supercontig 2 [Trichuris trichiura]
MCALCSPREPKHAATFALSVYAAIEKKDWDKRMKTCDWEVTTRDFKTLEEMDEFFLEFIPLATLAPDYIGANLGMFFMMLGKQIDPNYYQQWAQARMLAFLRVQGNASYEPSQVSIASTLDWHCGIVLSSASDKSLDFRRATISVINAAMSIVNFDKVAAQAWLLLRFAKMTGFALILNYLMLDIPHPILFDKYLEQDKYHLNEAIDLWNLTGAADKPYIRLIREGMDNLYGWNCHTKTRLYSMAIGKTACEINRTLACH